jgi:hypothetical protein
LPTPTGDSAATTAQAYVRVPVARPFKVDTAFSPTHRAFQLLVLAPITGSSLEVQYDDCGTLLGHINLTHIPKRVRKRTAIY